MQNATANQTRTIKPGTRFERAFTVDRAAIDEAARTVELSFSSEAPYERYWGVEILDHSPQSVRLARISQGAPFLMDHNSRDQVGVIESVQIDSATRKGRAVVRFGKSARANEVFQDVLDGIRPNISVGYVIHKALLVEVDEASGVDTYRVTEWEPFEISSVSIPADTSVGVGRSAAEADFFIPAATEPAEGRAALPPAISQGKTMDPVDTGKIAQDARQAELQRTLAIIAIGEQFKAQGGEKLAAEAVRSGATLEAFRATVMEKLATTLPTPAIGLSQKETQRYSIRAAIMAQASGDWKHAGFEREVSVAIAERQGDPANGGFYVPYEVQSQQRDMTSAGASGSNYLVATENKPQNFIEMLRARALLVKLGAVFLPGLVGNVTIPKQTGANTAYWLANEAAAITEGQMTIGQLAMTPKTIAAYTEISRTMLLQATPAADNLVFADFAKVLALGIDLAGLSGSGAGGQPVGIANTAGIGSVLGTTLGLAGVIEFQTDTASANALATSSAYVTTPAVAGLLMQRQRFASTDTPIWTGNVLDGLVSGFRAASTTQMAAASMLFGDFEQVVIGEWGQLEIAATNSEGSNFKAGIVGVRAFQSVDIGVRNAGAFSLATSIT